MTAVRRERSCDCGGVATLALPTFRSHLPFAWASLLTPNAIWQCTSRLTPPMLAGNLPRLQISGRAGGSEGAVMRRSRRIVVAAATALAFWLGSHLALAQKSGGVL